MSARIRDSVSTLKPGYFAMVMATGIVSVGMANHNLDGLSDILLWIAAVGYIVLLVLTVWRLAAYRAEVRTDFTDPSRGFGFFTFVAGTDVLGTRLALQGHRSVAIALLVVGWLGWLILGYVVPWTAQLGRAERPVLAAANGTWFMWVVASQSVAVLAAALEPSVHTGRQDLALLAVFCWSVGVLLYSGTGVFVAARMLLYPLRPVDLTPPYWIAMGATAISVLAGAKIVAMADTPMVDATRGLVAGVSVVFWVFGTWLIPALVAAGWWRHVVHRIPLRYDPTVWSVVFPLGMYGVAGHYLGAAEHLTVVSDIGNDEAWVALAAWAVTFAAMLRGLIRVLVLPASSHRDSDETADPALRVR
jgi:tellurite resistance protein TehA-like permease